MRTGTRNFSSNMLLVGAIYAYPILGSNLFDDYFLSGALRPLSMDSSSNDFSSLTISG